MGQSFAGKSKDWSDQALSELRKPAWANVNAGFLSGERIETMNNR
jgi:hypothetical protein